jgi:hypothetical protein
MLMLRQFFYPPLENSTTSITILKEIIRDVKEVVLDLAKGDDHVTA